SNVKVLPADGTVTISQITDGSVTLAGAVMALSAGDVIVANHGTTQFARKVVSVSSDGATTTVQTGHIQLSDVFSSADLERTVTVLPAAFEHMPPALPGVSIGKASKLADELAYVIPIEFDNSYITGPNGEPGVLLNGSINVRITFDETLKLNWDNTVNELKVVPTIQVDGSLTATLQAGASFNYVEKFTPTVRIPLTPLGPLAVTADLELELDIAAKAAGKVTQQVSGSATATVGPWYKNGAWTLVHAFDYTFSIPPPVVDAELSLWISAGRPKVALTLLGVASAWIRADGAKAGVEVRAVIAPAPGIAGQAKLKSGVSAGIDLLFGKITQNLGNFVFGPYEIGPSFFYTYPELYDMFIRATTTVPEVRVGEVIQLDTEARLNAGGASQPMAVTWTQKSSNGGSVAFGPRNEIQGLTPGFVTLTATEGSQSATYQLTVTAPRLKSLNITGNLSPAAGAELDLRAIALYSDASTQDVTDLCTWTSADSSVLTVDDGGRDYAVSQGSSSVMATYVDFSNPANAATTQATVTVQPPHVIDFEIERVDTPDVSVTRASLQVGDTVPLCAVGFVSDASRRCLTTELQWSSTNPAAASVDANGTVHGLSSGLTTIVANDPSTGRSQQVDVAVAHPTVSSLAIAPVASTPLVGQTLQLQSTATFSDATTGDATQTAGAAWFSGDPSVATVSAGGLVTPVNIGVVTIYAQYQRRQATVTLSVVGPERLSFTQQPPASVHSGTSGTIEIAIIGSDGNVFTGGSPTVTLALPDGTSGTTLGGAPLTVTASNGRAVFSNVT
ncbi:MAG: hypothetical protein EB084_23860, partial [Proteobacteria bacterium]|nr:hypothetical protein [Pseudomonadota bacterium]